MRARSPELNAMAGPSESILWRRFEIRVFSRWLRKIQEEGWAPRQYVRSKDWNVTVVRCYLTGGRARLDSEDINFDIYPRDRDLMHLSGLRMLPEQEVQKSNVHLWRLTRQASTASNGYAVRKYAADYTHAPCVTCTNARLDCALLRVQDLCSSS